MSEISIKELEDLCINVLTSAGLSEEDTKIAVDHFLENELSGKASHGLVRIVEASRDIKEKGVPKGPIIKETDTGSFVTFDAKRNLATTAGMLAAQTAIERAKEHGIALVGIQNYISSSGSMAYFLRRLTEEGITAIMGCNSVALVSPPGGRERTVGTNPVGIGIPGENGESMIADFATSAIAYGKIMVMKDKGQAVPEGVLIDKDGNPSINPKDAYDGAILPLADYRGFALGLMVELLAGPLIGGKAIKKNMHDQDGLFIIAIDAQRLGQNGYYAHISDALKQIYETPTMPGHDQITLPGDRSSKTLAENKARGTVNVVEGTLNQLKELANRQSR